MSEGIATGLVIIVMFLLLMGGTWVFVALGAAGILALYLADSSVVGGSAIQIWSSTNSSTLAAVPLFIFLGEIIFNSGLANALYTGLGHWLRRLPGGLLHSNVAACSVFSAISGSSIATAATIGPVAIPEQIARGYDRKLVLGSIASSGTLGILIPPSITMIIYGLFVEVSVAKLFMAGLVPGLILTVLFLLYVGIRCSIQRGLAPTDTGVSTWKDKLLGLKGMMPVTILIAFVLGSIYGGLMTPTEVSAVSGAVAIVLTVVTRRFSWRMLHNSILSAATTTAQVLLIYVGAKMLVMGLLYLGLPMKLPALIASLQLSPVIILLLIYAMYLILGCFFDSASLMLVTLPMVLPILVSLEIDLIWFGVVMTVLLEMGLITPPVGMNLYVILGITKDSTIGEVSIGVLPFILLMGVLIALLTVFPIVALWLPSTM